MNVKEWGYAIQKLTPLLPLTDHGLAKLAAFPPEALDHARLKMAIVHRKEDPFVYFITICRNYCIEKGLEPDWSQYKTMCRMYNIAENDSVFLDATKLQEIIAEAKEANKPEQYQKRDVRGFQSKATSSTAQKASVEQSNQFIRDRAERLAAPKANRDEVLSMILAEQWTDENKKHGPVDAKKALEFFNIAWPEGQEPDVARLYKKYDSQ